VVGGVRRGGGGDILSNQRGEKAHYEGNLAYEGALEEVKEGVKEGLQQKGAALLEEILRKNLCLPREEGKGNCVGFYSGTMEIYYAILGRKKGKGNWLPGRSGTSLMKGFFWEKERKKDHSGVRSL